MILVKLLRIIDKAFGNIIILFLSRLKRNKKTKNNKRAFKKILVIRLWTLGESILTLPMIKKLKEENYEISVLVTKRSKAVFKNLDFIDEVIELQHLWDIIKKIKKYDITIDTEPYFNISAILSYFLGKYTIGFKGLLRDRLYNSRITYDDKTHAVYNFCNLLKPLGINYKPQKLVSLKYTEKDKKYVDSLLKQFDLYDKKIIGIHCGTAETAPWRSWKKEKFAELAEKLIKDNYYIILTGTGNDYQINKEIINLVSNKHKIFNFAGKTNLREFAYLLTKFIIFISNDTGPMHLSAAMGTKTIGLFGPNLPERFAPFGEENIAIYKAKSLKCSPCINVHKGEFRNCKLNGRCMDLINIEDVYYIIIKLIKDRILT